MEYPFFPTNPTEICFVFFFHLCYGLFQFGAQSVDLLFQFHRISSARLGLEHLNRQRLMNS